MKLKQLILGVVPCLWFALVAQAAAQTTILDWKFSVAGNPSLPTSVVTPYGGTAKATFESGLNTYFFGAGPGGIFGSPTGLWDSLNGMLDLSISDRTAVSPLDYSLTITHFVDLQGFYPGTVNFSVPNVTYVGRTVVVPQTGIMTGSWVADTYQWTGVDLGYLPVRLDIAPGAGSGDLLFDEVQLTITGALSEIPEPVGLQMAGMGLLALGFRWWLRRSRKA